MTTMQTMVRPSTTTKQWGQALVLLGLIGVLVAAALAGITFLDIQRASDSSSAAGEAAKFIGAATVFGGIATPSLLAATFGWYLGRS
jgi:hypothetical protein